MSPKSDKPESDDLPAEDIAAIEAREILAVVYETIAQRRRAQRESFLAGGRIIFTCNGKADTPDVQGMMELMKRQLTVLHRQKPFDPHTFAERFSRFVLWEGEVVVGTNTHHVRIHVGDLVPDVAVDCLARGLYALPQNACLPDEIHDELQIPNLEASLEMLKMRAGGIALEAIGKNDFIRARAALTLFAPDEVPEVAAALDALLQEYWKRHKADDPRAMQGFQELEEMRRSWLGCLTSRETNRLIAGVLGSEDEGSVH